MPYTFTTDERILSDLMRQLNWSDIGCKDLRLQVADGLVYLRGSVQTCAEVIEAERAARAVYGVHRILNEIAVVPQHHRSDAEIGKELVIALRNTASVIDELPEIEVRDGIAILRGRCRWEFQCLCAERTALSIIGVRRVVNLMAVDTADSSRLIARAESTGIHLISKAS